MAVQGVIQRRLAQPDAIELIRNLLEADLDINRTELADRLCEQFDLVDARGHRRLSGCLKALRALASRGLFTLPLPQTKTGSSTPRRLRRSVPAPQHVPKSVGKVRGLELVVVESEEQMRVWNEMFVREHPRGTGPLVGRQLRYLIGSKHGWLGGLAFAAPALYLEARDHWIGWDMETRRAYLDRVVGLARFLIRPVQCHNLASRVLAMAMKRLPRDFEACYGYRPWLVETFVDTSGFVGTCFQAANWLRVGSSQGRGRQDRGRLRLETVKDIYIYELEKDFRAQMGLPEYSGGDHPPVDAGLDDEVWAEHEFGEAPLGNRRWSKRLVKSAMIQAEAPMRIFASVARGDRAKVKGYYRFIDQPDDSALTMENILAPHRQRTMERMKGQKTVLCIQDGTDLDYNALDGCEGLGVIGTNEAGIQSRGLHLHSTLAVTTDGLPLGMLHSQCWAPTREARELPTETPIEGKDPWIPGIRDCRAVAARVPHTRVVAVMDQEAIPASTGIFELFDEWRQDPSIDLLVGVQQNHLTTDYGNIIDAIKGIEPQLRLEILVSRQNVGPKGYKQMAGPKQAEHRAGCVLRYQQTELPPPPYHSSKVPIPLWTIHVVEENPLPGVGPIDWFLLTTMQIRSPAQAKRCLRWYCLQWRLGDWLRVLKTDCKVEDLRHYTAERLKRAIAIKAVVAWRILLMCLLGRETPGLPAELPISDIDIKVRSSPGHEKI